MSFMYKIYGFDGTSDYVLWKCKMEALLVEKEVHGAIDVEELHEKASDSDKKKIEKRLCFYFVKPLS